MKLALAQLNLVIGDLTGNAAQILTAAQQAAAQEAQLLLTPELSLCGYPPRDLLMNPAFIDAMAATLRQLAQDLPENLAVLVGTVAPNPRSRSLGGKPLYNSVALLRRGQVEQYFHKRLLPTYDVFDENRYFEPGQHPNVLALEGWRLGITICEDLWNDEQFWGTRNYASDPVADLAQQGVDLIVNLSASPYRAGKQHLREAILCHSARRYSQPLLYANQVGGNDELIFDGSSVACNRQGVVVARARAFEPDLRCLTLDETQRDLLPDVVTPPPESEDAEIWAALVLGVRDYVHKCNFTRVVLGLSGGVDSALVAAIATEALAAENVLGVLMPSPYSSDHSIQDALALAENLGMATRILPIAAAMKAYEQILDPVFAGMPAGVAEENIQARIRGNLLMAIANKFGYLLISTGNKSEMAVGYCTLYGDMSGGLAAIADVPKTRVYSLCRWLNTRAANRNGRRELIPTNILTKAPSAELKPGQVDQDSLPSYEVLDDILQQLIDRHHTAAQIVESGHDPTIVQKVIQMVAGAEFKRRQAPPGLKITDRAFGSGWRMPIAARPASAITQTTTQEAI